MMEWKIKAIFSSRKQELLKYFYIFFLLSTNFDQILAICHVPYFRE